MHLNFICHCALVVAALAHSSQAEHLIILRFGTALESNYVVSIALAIHGS